MFGISNYYGGLEICEDNGRFFWTVGGDGGDGWVEIPKHLYDTLFEFIVEEE
jgi:hypothetical protein